MAYVLWILAMGVAAVQADCGHCPTQNIIDHQELLQAQAYNAMPKNWETVDVGQDQQAFYEGGYGFGPKKCVGACQKPHFLTTDRKCYYKNDRSPYMRRQTCAPRYHDRQERLCRETPQWDPYYGMWCRTYYEMTLSNWGRTHFPICVSTGKMCYNPQQDEFGDLNDWDFDDWD